MRWVVAVAVAVAVALAVAVSVAVAAAVGVGVTVAVGVGVAVAVAVGVAVAVAVGVGVGVVEAVVMISSGGFVPSRLLSALAGRWTSPDSPSEIRVRGRPPSSGIPGCTGFRWRGPRC